MATTLGFLLSTYTILHYIHTDLQRNYFKILLKSNAALHAIDISKVVDYLFKNLNLLVLAYQNLIHCYRRGKGCLHKYFQS